MRRIGLAAAIGWAVVANATAGRAAHDDVPRVAAGFDVPRVAAGDLARPLPRPYRADADAEREVTAALARAQRSGKRVLIDLGGNWCPDCRMLAGVLAIPAVQAFTERHFELVMVDIGHFDKNLALPARFGAPVPVGVPTVLVVTKQGRLLNRDRREDLANDRTETPQAIVDWLAQWAAAR